MHVAVAGMGDVDDADLVPAADFRDPAEDVRQLRPRHHAVLDQVAGAQAAHGADRRLAALPQQLALGRRGGLDDLAGLVVAAERR